MNAAPQQASRHGTFHRLRVAAVEPLTEDSVAITFAVPPELAADYAHVAGQHVTVRREERDARRNYSICAPTGGPLRIGVRRLPGGDFSGYATTELRPGDELDVMTPTGRFLVRPGAGRAEPAPARHVVALAAGSGITPVIAVLASVLSEEPASTATLVYGNRTTGSVMFLDELADLKDRFPARFRLLHLLSRERRDLEALTGRLDAARLRELLDDGGLLADEADGAEWYLCGPFGMVEDARKVLAERGVPAAAVHAELFHVDGTPPPPAVRAAEPGADDAEASAISVLLDGRRTELRLRPDGEPVLDAVLRVRGDAPFACRGGVCGTCRAKLLAGEVAMDHNYALEPEETAAGYVLCCQSHPRSREVVLDFDA